MTPLLSHAPAGPAEHLRLGLALANLSSELLTHSGLLLKRCLTASTETVAEGLTLQFAIAKLLPYWNNDTRPAMTEDFLKMLHRALKAAETSARQSSAAALEMLALIGDTHTMPLYVRPRYLGEMTIWEIGVQLARAVDQLHRMQEHAGEAKEELQAIHRRISAMMDNACNNLAQARSAVLAAENLLLQSSNFMRQANAMSANRRPDFD